MLNHLKNEMNYTTTENGAVTHKSSHSHLLDFFSLAGAVRNRSEKDITSMFSKAFNENPDYAMKALFLMRDIRYGNGERRLFRICTQWLAQNEPASLIKNLPHIAEYGRWDDLIVLVDSPIKDKVIEIIKQQVDDDFIGTVIGGTISLIGKWLMSENASSPETKRLAKIIRKSLGYTPKAYRKLLSKLREHINVLERTMSANQWQEVDYSKVPSQAMMKYRTAFYRNDEERYDAYLKALNAPVRELVRSVKINTKTLYPYQIVEKAINDYHMSDQDFQLFNAMWENLPDVVGDNYQNSLAVIDVSGSMHGQPMNVAISLGLYIAEKNKGAYHNHFLTFSSNPQLVEIKGSNFIDKVRNISGANWGMSTDLEKTFDLILNTAVKQMLPQSELPTTLYIISDMEFNEASRGGRTNFELMKEKFKAHGYKLPRVVFWNVDARQNQAPVVKDTPNVQMVSGFSLNLFSSLLEQRDYNPYEYMLDVLKNDRYEVISA